MLLRVRGEAALNQAEDPRQTLDYSYERQLELLQQMRRAVADTVTSRKRIELQGLQLERTAEKLDGQARQALGQDREDLAREALARRAAIGTELADLRAQRGAMLDEETRLVESTARLEAQVAAFRRRKETLKATYTAADARAKVREAASGLSKEHSELQLAMHRAEDKIEQTQARAAALEELTDSGALEDLSHDRIQAQLDVNSQRRLVESELQRLRAELPPPEVQVAPALPAPTPRRARKPRAEPSPKPPAQAPEPAPQLAAEAPPAAARPARTRRPKAEPPAGPATPAAPAAPRPRRARRSPDATSE